MALTTSLYVDRVYERISGGLPQASIGVYRDAIQSTMPDAIYELCVMSLTERWRNELEADFALPLTSGIASFSGSTTLLPESIKYCEKITHPSITGPGTLLLPLHIKDTREAMNVATAATASIFGYAYVGKSAVEAVYQGALLAGTITVRAVAIPTITSGTSTVPVVLESKLIDVGSQLALSKVAASQEPPAQ